MYSAGWVQDWVQAVAKMVAVPRTDLTDPLIICGIPPNPTTNKASMTFSHSLNAMATAPMPAYCSSEKSFRRSFDFEWVVAPRAGLRMCGIRDMLLVVGWPVHHTIAAELGVLPL
jgi:hypothetical protein